MTKYSKMNEMKVIYQNVCDAGKQQDLEEIYSTKFL